MSHGIRSKIAKELIESKTVKGKCMLSKKKLGEILHSRHPDLFDSAEKGRSTIKYITKSNGVKDRKRKIANEVEWNGFDLPEPEKNDFSKFLIKEKRVAIFSDIHFPYYDKTALNSAVKHTKIINPTCIVLNGDIIDCYHLSNFEKDPRKRKFSYELDMLKGFFLQLRKLFPNVRIIYKLGNHEERYERLILQRVPEFIDLEMFQFENVIKAREVGIEVVTNKRLIRCGHLNIAHGHEFRAGITAPVNPARGYYLKAKANVIAGHNHRTSEHTEQDINGKIIGAWSMGCLSELNPHYMPINSWNHGFADIEFSGDDFRVQNMKIVNGKIL